MKMWERWGKKVNHSLLASLKLQLIIWKGEVQWYLNNITIQLLSQEINYMYEYVPKQHRYHRNSIK